MKRTSSVIAFGDQAQAKGKVNHFGYSNCAGMTAMGMLIFPGFKPANFWDPTNARWTKASGNVLPVGVDSSGALYTPSRANQVIENCSGYDLHMPINRHGGAANFAMVDGHVASIQAGGLRNYHVSLHIR